MAAVKFIVRLLSTFTIVIHGAPTFQHTAEPLQSHSSSVHPLLPCPAPSVLLHGLGPVVHLSKAMSYSTLTTTVTGLLQYPTTAGIDPVFGGLGPVILEKTIMCQEPKLLPTTTRTLFVTATATGHIIAHPESHKPTDTPKPSAPSHSTEVVEHEYRRNFNDHLLSRSPSTFTTTITVGHGRAWSLTESPAERTRTRNPFTLPGGLHGGHGPVVPGAASASATSDSKPLRQPLLPESLSEPVPTPSAV